MEIVRVCRRFETVSEKERHKTQAEVGREAGISIGYVSALENGRMDARPEVVAALAGAVYCEPPDLLRGPSRSRSPGSPPGSPPCR